MSDKSKYNGIDQRTIKCACEDKQCAEGGISFDGGFLRFHFLEFLPETNIRSEMLYQATRSMKMSIENIEQLQKELVDEKKRLRRIKSRAERNKKPPVL